MIDGFPSFSLDSDGNVVTDSSFPTGWFPDGIPSPDPPGTVSGGDVLPSDSPLPSVSPLPFDHPVFLPADSSAIAEIAEGLERLIQDQASSSGYLSSSALDVFDRVVSGYSYDYYCAFRYDSDSYNALMYLSDDIQVSGSSVLLEDPLCVRLYRVYNNSTRAYDYHYSVSSPGDVSVSLSGSLMYYTNCVEGYPVLGGLPSPGGYSPQSIILWFWLILGFVFVWRFSRR
ncbi:MAG: hypothetical protein HFH90_08825 [Lachnospiraceae bacterium]|jgi:hypothetical protein|nr:hypothetical protein [Lachnospiraceae bacterium]